MMPHREAWENHELTNGEMRTLLKIMLGLHENEQVCDFVVMANIYTSEDGTDFSHHELGTYHKGVIFTSVQPDELSQYVAEAMRQV